MYTQCPECSSVYRVTSTDLRLAGGEVRCGSCGARFDALDRLSDTFPSADVEGPATDEAVESTTPRVETAAEQGPEEEDAAETAPVEKQKTAQAESEADLADSTPVTAGADRDNEEQDDEPTIDLEMSAEEVFSLAELQDQELPEISELEFLEGLPSRDTGDEVEETTGPPAELIEPVPARHRARMNWLAGAALVILLAGIWIHGQRGILMRSDATAPVIAWLYGLFGVDVAPDWDVAAFRITESSASIGADGNLQISLDFVNDADFAQPFPVLRVSLEDRWGDEIGRRELAASQYMGAGVADRTLGPGRHARGQVSVADPMPEAVGFRLDLCLPGAGSQLRCASNQP